MLPNRIPKSMANLAIDTDIIELLRLEPNMSRFVSDILRKYYTIRKTNDIKDLTDVAFLKEDLKKKIYLIEQDMKQLDMIEDQLKKGIEKDNNTESE